MTIKEIQDEIIEEFSYLEEWTDKYEYLIDFSKQLPLIKSEQKNVRNLINGCQSKVWIYAELIDGKINYTADSDAIITKGIIALLIKVMDKRTPDEILNSELNFIDKIGLGQNLSPTRANGLVAMIKQMKLYAMAYKAKMNK